MNERIEAGRIVNTHGLQGEVKIEVWLDSPDYFLSFPRLFAGDRELTILSGRVHKGFVMARLGGVDSLEKAEQLKGAVVDIKRSDAPGEEDPLFVGDIIGFEVIDENGERVGTLVDALERPASLIYIVKGETEHLIPAVDEFVLSVDTDKKQIVVHMIEGL